MPSAIERALAFLSSLSEELRSIEDIEELDAFADSIDMEREAFAAAAALEQVPAPPATVAGPV